MSDQGKAESGEQETAEGGNASDEAQTETTAANEEANNANSQEASEAKEDKLANKSVTKSATKSGSTSINASAAKSGTKSSTSQTNGSATVQKETSKAAKSKETTSNGSATAAGSASRQSESKESSKQASGAASKTKNKTTSSNGLDGGSATKAKSSSQMKSATKSHKVESKLKSSSKASSKEASAQKSKKDITASSKIKSKVKSTSATSSGGSPPHLFLAQCAPDDSPKKKKDKSKLKTKSKSDSAKQNSKSLPQSVFSASKAKSKSVDRKKTSSSDIKMSKKKKVDLAGAKVGFVGAGKMTDAIVRGLSTIAKIENKKIFIAAKSDKNLDQFKEKGINITKRSYDIFGQFDCDIVFLAVHGYVIRSCFKGGGSRAFAFTINYIPNQKHPLYLLSLIGGVNLADIRSTLLDPDNPDKYMLEMHRIMLNIGVGYGLGMGAIDVEPDSNKCSPVVRDLLTSIAKLEYMPDQLMDAACSLSGNGLAFCYYFVSAIADGGFKMGIEKNVAIRLAGKALQSAAQCLLESNKHPSELQDSVTSRAGPSIYGLHVLEKADCASGFQAAIETAFRRLKELVDIEPGAEIEAKPFNLNN